MSLSSLQMDLANDQKLGIVPIIQMQLSRTLGHAKMSRDCLKTIKMRYIAKKGDGHSGSYKNNKTVNKACFLKAEHENKLCKTNGRQTALAKLRIKMSRL